MSKKAIIHIGAPKTGSTAIQTFCYQNRFYLLENYDIYYPDHEQLIRPESGFGHHYIAFHIWRKRINEKLIPSYIKIEETFKILEDVLKFSNHKYLLLSCETLLHIPLSNKFQEFMSILSKYYEDLWIILYVRRQDVLIQAIYQTFIRSGEGLEINNFIKNRLRNFDFYNIVKLYEQAGFKVLVRAYEKNYMKNRDLINDFIESLRDILNIPISMPPDYQPSAYKDINVSLPDFITEMIRYYNSRPSKYKVVPILKKLGLELIKRYPNLSKHDFIPPSKRREILNYYKESNLKLSKEYLGLDGLWYDDSDIPLSDDEWLKENNFEGKQIVKLAKVVLKILKGGN